MNRLPFFDRPDDSLLRHATRIKIDMMRDGEHEILAFEVHGVVISDKETDEDDPQAIASRLLAAFSRSGGGE
ncbi:MAG: hypothetical protein AB7O38_12600 [Pirellulaceae bacterium]